MWGFKPRAPWLTTYLKRPYLELKEDQMSARRFPKHLKLWAMSSFNCMDGHGCLWISMRQSSSISGQQHSFRTFSGWNLGHTRALLHLLQGQLKIETCARNAMQCNEEGYALSQISLLLNKFLVKFMNWTLLRDQTAGWHLCHSPFLQRRSQVQKSWPSFRCWVPSFSFLGCTSEGRRGHQSCQAPLLRWDPLSMCFRGSRKPRREQTDQANLLACPRWRNLKASSRNQEASNSAGPQGQWMPSLPILAQNSETKTHDTAKACEAIGLRSHHDKQKTSTNNMPRVNLRGI